ncbi:MAG: leucine-rich repeat domain-containing protein, partial [Bacteroidales bacterium]|nr:leucine-rich repeat domain-containing protein [Bacteroidales bacterium]
VTSIGGGAFTSCIRLTSVTIPNSVTSIGNSAFLGCSGLTSVTIPNSVTSIGLSAFSGCTGLTSVVFNADSCTSAGSSSSPVFRGCLNINSFVFGNNVKVIPAYLCNGMGGLTSITIPDSVTSIGDQAFSSCSGLTSVSVSNGNTIYDSRNGCNAIIHTSSNTLISGCRNTLIPNTVTSIGDYAFSGCTGLTSVTIPNSVTSIGTSAFYECSGLTEINSLASVAPQLGSNAFSNVTSTIPVNIPCGSSASYYSRWSYFSNFVEAASPTFSVQSANTAMGTVSILTQPTCQAPTAVFQATANNGFQFSHWSDHNMDNPRSISLTQDTSFTAYFAPATHDTVIVHDTVTNTVHDTLVVTDTVTNTVHDTLVVTDTITIDRYDTIYLHDTIYIHDTLFMGSEGIGDVKTIDAKIYARDGQIVVEGAEGMPVVLYDAVGRQLTALREEAHGGTPLRFDVPASGVYIVKIGTLAAQKVVVIR